MKMQRMALLLMPMSENRQKIGKKIGRKKDKK